MTAIRKVELTESGEATFLTSDSRLSIIQMLPVGPTEEAQLEYERILRGKTRTTLTYSEAKTAAKAPRLPPRTYESTLMLLTTYALFIEMLFGKNNAHLQGINAIRGQLMSMAQISRNLTPLYFENIIWAVIDDMCKHFNECMAMADFEETGLAYGLV